MCGDAFLLQCAARRAHDRRLEEARAKRLMQSHERDQRRVGSHGQGASGSVGRAGLTTSYHRTGTAACSAQETRGRKESGAGWALGPHVLTASLQAAATKAQSCRRGSASDGAREADCSSTYTAREADRCCSFTACPVEATAFHAACAGRASHRRYRRGCCRNRRQGPL